MSLGGDPDDVLDTAVRNSIASGLTYVVAAGHLQIDLIAPDGAAYPIKDSYEGWGTVDLHGVFGVDASTEPANGGRRLRGTDRWAGYRGYIDRWALRF